MLNLQFEGKFWIYTGPGAWHFVTLPMETAEQIKFFRERHHGFGTVRVTAMIGQTEWKTSLFPDKASGSFLLPIKAAVRKKENLTTGQTLSVSISLDL